MMPSGFRMKANADKTAEVFIYDDIGGGSFFNEGLTAKSFSDELKSLGSLNQIDVRINSGGGDVFDGVAIHRQLLDHKAKVVVHIDGIAASIASVIAMAGDEIHMSESGFIMIHNASGMAMGTASDMRKLADILDTVSDTISNVYAQRTLKSPAKVKAWMDAETWFTASEAKTNGFVDSIAANLKVAACLDNSKYKYKHVPETVASKQASAFMMRRKEQLDIQRLEILKRKQ